MQGVSRSATLLSSMWESIAILVGFDRPETLPRALTDATPADRARWIFEHACRRATRRGIAAGRS